MPPDGVSVEAAGLSWQNLRVYEFRWFQDKPETSV